MSHYEQKWESLETSQEPQWFADAKFGVYFHWGPYSVPAFETEWYPRRMYQEGTEEFHHHRETYGDQSEVGYKSFIPDFHGDEFDADTWVDTCVNAGAEFVGVTAIHHDGFAMWDSDITEWNAAAMGPERDVVGEVAEAARDRGLKFVAAFHHAWNWWYYPRKDEYDTTDPEYAGLYGPPHEEGEDPPESYFQDWYDKTVEVIDTYRPDLIWFDFGWGNSAFSERDEYRKALVAHYYNRAEEWGKSVGVAHKRNLPVGVGIVDYERSRREALALEPWLTDTSVDRESWGYISDPDYKDVDTLVTGFVDRLSKNGNTLLNVGPRPDGTLPEPAVDLLEGFGDWVETNADAVYGSRPWWVFGEGPTEVTSTEFEEASAIKFGPDDRRFLRNGDDAYVVFFEWPEDGTLDIETSIHRRVSGRERADDPVVPAAIELLGTDVLVEGIVADDNDSLRLSLPETPPAGLDHAYVLQLTPKDPSQI